MDMMRVMRIARVALSSRSKRTAPTASRCITTLLSSNSACSSSRAPQARNSGFQRVKTRSLSSSDASASDDEPFDVRADRAWRALSGVHDVVLARHSREKLEELRKEAARADLWEGDAAHAGRIVQQLAVLEARESKAKELQRTFLDTRELFSLAKEEKDEALMRDCGDTMGQVLAEAQQMRVQLLLLGSGDDEDDDAAENASSCFVEIQAGAGGADSCDWVALLARMYARWGTSRQFSVHTVDESPGVDGVGMRSVMLRLDGEFAYGWTRTEAGVHRLVRVSPFDSARRRHTSFAQVRVYPMSVAGSGSGSSKKNEVEIPTKDLRIDSFRSSGAGGQHVNTTDSAIRITHLPTGIVVQCQSDRSQHRNKASAMEVLRAKLRQRELETRAAKKRQYALGLGENAWGSQIRSYVMHPYTLVKDHRTNHSETNVERVLDGEIDGFMEEMLLAQTKRDESVDE